jgi:hypothetical protein
MKKGLLIALSLSLALAGWNLAWAQDFYVIPVTKANYAPVPKTGQTNPSGTGTDGALQKGVAWPNPRFIDNGNGTVTDKLTGLIWMQQASSLGQKNWGDALSAANGLASDSYGLADGSKAGDWRLPNARELQSLVDYGRYGPALPAPNPFTAVQSAAYWSSTTYASDADAAWLVDFNGGVEYYNGKSYAGYVWCVRGGK